MTRAITTDPDSAGSASTIELGVLADPSQLSVTRAVAAALAAQEDFDLDSIADIRLAIDESCSRLIVRATPGARLVCAFTPGPDVLEVAVTTTTEPGADLDASGFGWHVLNALTDTVSTSQTEHEGVVSTTIEFTKRKHGLDE
ncbi:ATP-binding protein [Rhodococcoides kroppenstedtii]|uniref:ATP-binding protein n=1 Tax=Rhodococcoides kroppenstedtii TaxID=293050 RepID=UPI00363E722E